MRSVRPGNALSRNGITCLVLDPHIPASSDLALLPHRLLVPQPDAIAVGILELRAVAPERLLGWMVELYTRRAQRLVLGLDVADLERQHAARPPRSAGRLGEEQRETELVLYRGGPPLGDLELELQPERLHVPLTRLVTVAHRDREVVQLDHEPSPWRGQHTTRPACQSRNTGAAPAVDDGNHGGADQLDGGRRVTVRGQRDLAAPQPLELQEPLHAAREAPAVARQRQMLDQPVGDLGRRLPGLRSPKQRPQHLRLSLLQLSRVGLGEPDRGRHVANIVEAKAEPARSEEHTSELQSPCNLVCRLLLEKKKKKRKTLQIKKKKKSKQIQEKK